MEKTNLKVFCATVAFVVAIVGAGCISTSMSDGVAASTVETIMVEDEQTFEFGNGTSMHIEVSPR